MKLGCLDQEKLYAMPLHSEEIAHDGTMFITVIRVAGGWIYQSVDKGNGIFGSVFVPFNNEFMNFRTKERE